MSSLCGVELCVSLLVNARDVFWLVGLFVRCFVPFLSLLTAPASVCGAVRPHTSRGGDPGPWGQVTRSHSERNRRHLPRRPSALTQRPVPRRGGLRAARVRVLPRRRHRVAHSTEADSGAQPSCVCPSLRAVQQERRCRASTSGTLTQRPGWRGAVYAW